MKTLVINGLEGLVPSPDNCKAIYDFCLENNFEIICLFRTHDQYLRFLEKSNGFNKCWTGRVCTTAIYDSKPEKYYKYIATADIYIPEFIKDVLPFLNGIDPLCHSS